jgi:nucleoid DNA-binding protein
MKAGKLVTKTQIIDIVSEGTGLTKVETAAVIDGFLATITWAASNDRRVALRGFGSFDAVQRRARITRNPRTGEKMMVAARRAVVFRPAKELREVVNQSPPEEKSPVSVVEETK